MLHRIRKSWWMLLLSAAVLAACGSVDEAQETLEEVDPPQYVEDEEELGLEEEMDEELFEGLDEELEEELEQELNGDEEVAEETEEKGGTAVEGEDKGETAEETAMLELYLMDKNGMVTPQALDLPSSESDVLQSMAYLVKDGPVTELLPNGFQAVLPSGTEVLDANITEEGVAVVDFSSDFEEYRAEDELKILQSVTWTLTQFDDIDRVQIKIGGEEQEVMPQNGTPVAEGYTRSHGINLETGDLSDLSNTKPVTVYFLSQNEDQTYYVPVTRRVSSTDDTYTAVVDELLKGPDMLTSLLTDFRNEAELVEEPSYRDGTVTLNFNDGLLSQLEGTALSEHVVNMLVLSLTEQEEVEQVAIEVDEHDDQLMVSSGETITEPVTRPVTVNTGKY
ncbi:GerMN domain-containing protein [Alteribacter populi]|uniref:GerMN domain-containing protein n=1 Tax=Alteribacter populi TaxID=2011011 RepID=UPI000BBB6054|nr:GerMN domain-containing protein [Alteribacter populi]